MLVREEFRKGIGREEFVAGRVKFFRFGPIIVLL